MLLQHFLLRNEKDGFFAMSNKESSCEKILCEIFSKMDDVTARINGKLNPQMSADERRAVIEADIQSHPKRKFRKWEIY